MGNLINNETLRQVREDRGLTQAELAKKVECTTDTVSRWERGQTSRVRSRLRDPLCEALRTDWESLTQPPKPKAEPPVRKDLVQLNVPIRREVRNSLQLVCERYNVDQRTVVEFAPLLFLIAAEQSLKRRRETLAKVQAELQAAYSTMREKAPYLGDHCVKESTAEALDREEEAISWRDIFRYGEDVPDHDGYDPFVNLIQEQATDLPEDTITHLAPSVAGYVDYVIGIDTLNEMFGLDPEPGSDEHSDRVRAVITSGKLDLRVVQKKYADSTRDTDTGLAWQAWSDWIKAVFDEPSEPKLNTKTADIMTAVEEGRIRWGDFPRVADELSDEEES